MSPPGSVNGTGCGNSVTYTGEDDENEKDRPLGQCSNGLVTGTRCVPGLTTAEPPTAGRQPGKGEGRTTEEVTQLPKSQSTSKVALFGPGLYFLPVLLAINELEHRKINSVCVTLRVYQQHARHTHTHTQLLGSCRRGAGCALRAPKWRSQPHTWASSRLGWHQWPLLNNRKVWAGCPQDHVGDTSRAKGLAEGTTSGLTSQHLPCQLSGEGCRLTWHLAIAAPSQMLPEGACCPVWIGCPCLARWGPVLAWS